MATQDSINKFFHSYIGKKISDQGCRCFGRWLIADSNKQEKEKILKHFWLTIDGKVINDTFNDWQLLHNRICKSLVRKHHLQWLKYVAVITLFFLSISGTYYIAIRNTLSKPIEMVEVFAPCGERKEFYLPDKSKVLLNSGSTIIYAKNFERNTSRFIYLTGEATFFVQKDQSKPFIVKTSTMDIEALGTIFTVAANPTEQFTITTLEEGLIRVNINNKKLERYILTPSEQLTLSNRNGLVKIAKVNIKDYVKRRNGYLIFNDSSFKDIISAIEKKYGVTFQYNSNLYSNELYNLKIFPDETIEDVMTILQQLIGFKYKIINENIIIK